MANLNIPFVLLQKETCEFSPAIGASRLIHHSRFNLRDTASNPPENSAAGNASHVSEQEESQASTGLFSYLGGVLSNVTGRSGENTLSTKQLKAPIQFESARENLLVLADEKTGTLALCSHELHGSDSLAGGSSSPARLLINIQPRVLLLPSLVAAKEAGPGPLLSHCMVRCPAPNILNASAFWLCTLHSDNRLRLWNTDDGRCISVSQVRFLDKAENLGGAAAGSQPNAVKGLAVAAVEGFPGHIFVFTDAGDVCIVDVYKMQVRSVVHLESKGFLGCHYIAAQNLLVFCDARGAIHLIQDKMNTSNNRVKIDEFHSDSVAKHAQEVNSSQSGVQRITEELKVQRQNSKSGNQNASSRRATGHGSSSQMCAGQKRMLKFCRNQNVTNFKFQQVMKLGGRETLEVGRLKQSQTLAYDFDLRTKSVAVVVAQDQIEQVIAEESADGRKTFTRQPLKQFLDESILVFAEFMRAPHQNGKQYLVCINVQCEVLIYDMFDLQRPKLDLTQEELAQFRCDFVQPIKTLKLLEKCQVTDYHQIWIKDTFTDMTSEHKTKEEHLQSRLDRLKEHLLEIFEEMSAEAAEQLPSQLEKQKRCSLFNYSHEEHLLYSFVKVHNKNVLTPQETNLILSWDFRAILTHCTSAEDDSALQVPMNISNLTLFGSQSKQSEPHIPNSLINFNSQVLKSFYNSSQFRFFYTDEKVTASVIFQDNDSPSSIIGTNYGRIFMIPMFQEQQFKHVVPTILIDSHKGSPITKLYLAYQGALHASDEGGGHLLSISADGTICATDLKSDSIAKKMYAKGPAQSATSQRRRTDQFMHEKGKNMRLQRRHSVSQYFSAEDFFKYERVRATEVFEEMAFSTVKHIFRVKSFQEAQNYLINARQTKPRSKPKLELPKQHYAFITEEREVLILTVHASPQSQARFQLTKLPLMAQPTIGIYLDQTSQSLFILGEDLSWRQFCLRSHNLNQRRRNFTDALIMLEVPQLVENLMQSNDHFFRSMRVEDCDLLSFENFQKDFNKAKILKGLGTHQCLDFLNLSLSVPLCYSPQSHLLKEYTVQLRYLLTFKKELLSFQENEESQKSMLRAVNKILNWDHDYFMKSDVTRKQASIIAMETQGEHFCGSNQQVLIASTQDMLPALQSKMKRIKALQEKPAEISQYFGGGAEESKGANLSRQKTDAARKASETSPDKRLINTGQEQQPQDFRQSGVSQQDQKQSYGMDRYRWPSKILSLVHPFNLHDGMDESLEEFFNLNMPFLDFRIGIQGIDEAFSFIITKEDRNYHNERDHISKIMGLLKISRQLRRLAHQSQKTLVVENFIEQHIDPQDSTLYLGRFFNSEYWKTSSYLSTIVPAFLLSSFVSIIEYDEKEICLLSQVWLDIVHHIRHASRFRQSCASPLRSPTTLSTSVLSQLLLLQDLNVSSCAKDIIFKPMLCHQSDFDKKELQTEIADWLALVIDTYEELKQETTAQSEDGPGTGAANHHSKATPARGVGGDHAVENIMRMTLDGQADRAAFQNPNAGGAQGAGGRRDNHGSNDVDHNAMDQLVERRSGVPQENRPLSHFFGELEIKGLINISFYAFYCQVDPSQQLGQRDLDRVSKLVVILIREVVQQFQDRKDYIHLLTILLYLLQCNLKTATANFKRKAIMEDVVRLLLFIFNYYKPPLNRELFITRVTSENFNLIRPTNSELYLKLVAAKTLLEIGVSFTEEFLQLIQFHATTLRPSHEHQKNVLETLRYFINGYGENLEKYLIQIVQILLRCLDPNELALRKNSHKYVSVILSNMVKIFPMVAFHYDTQRLAVGTHDGPIGIYDVRTSAKWKILEGHTKNVTCLCFDSKGNYLASYSAIDLTLKLWKVGNTSFFATIMGGTGRFAKQIKLTNLGSNVANPHVHTTHAPNHVEMENRDRKFQETNEISRGGQGGEGADLLGGQGAQGGNNQSNANSGNRISRCHIKFMRNDKDVELIREDGSKELHSLIR